MALVSSLVSGWGFRVHEVPVTAIHGRSGCGAARCQPACWLGCARGLRVLRPGVRMCHNCL